MDHVKADWRNINQVSSWPASSGFVDLTSVSNRSIGLRKWLLRHELRI